MEFISSRIANLSESATMAMNQASKDLKAKGVDVINLSVGEPDFYTPDHIKAAGKKAIDDNISFYPPAPGFPELREAVSKKLKRENCGPTTLKPQLDLRGKLRRIKLRNKKRFGFKILNPYKTVKKYSSTSQHQNMSPTSSAIK